MCENHQFSLKMYFLVKRFMFWKDWSQLHYLANMNLFSQSPKKFKTTVRTVPMKGFFVQKKLVLTFKSLRKDLGHLIKSKVKLWKINMLCFDEKILAYLCAHRKSIFSDKRKRTEWAVRMKGTFVQKKLVLTFRYKASLKKDLHRDLFLIFSSQACSTF